jgi:hypothetical protein
MTFGTQVGACPRFARNFPFRFLSFSLSSTFAALLSAPPIFPIVDESPNPYDGIA